MIKLSSLPKILTVYPCVYREHQFRLDLFHRHPRFIPVYTGNILTGSMFDCAYAVYPCVYREHRNFVFIMHGSFGLSLCIQGTLGSVYMIYVLLRFIPVYTGNMSYLRMKFGTFAVYPCVYREHADNSQLFFNLSLCIQGTLSQ